MRTALLVLLMTNVGVAEIRHREGKTRPIFTPTSRGHLVDVLVLGPQVVELPDFPNFDHHHVIDPHAVEVPDFPNSDANDETWDLRFFEIIKVDKSSFSFNVPEPSTLALLLVGGLASLSRLRRAL